VLLLLNSSGVPPLNGVSPFEKDRGLQQGRIAVSDAPAGSYVFELGHSANEEVSLDVGDYAEVSRSVNLDGQAAAVRLRAAIVPPPDLPSGLEWEFSGRLNGTVLFSRRVVADERNLQLLDLALSAADSNRPAADTIAFRLEVVNA